MCSHNAKMDGISIDLTTSRPYPPRTNKHLQLKTSSSITDSVIDNYDDCVSFKPNSTNIVVSRLHCNGSHGISVGSLGQYAGETDIVANVSVSDIYMANAQYGARIKVFGGNPDPRSTSGGGWGFVKNITFSDFVNVNNDYPIYINQRYPTPAATCAQYPSTLAISDVHYHNVTGTSSGKYKQVVVDIECSATCQNITADGTKLAPPSGAAAYTCKNIASTAQVRIFTLVLA